MTVSLKNHRRLAYFIRLQHRYLRAFNFTQNVKWTVVNIHSPSQCTALASKFDLFTRFACGQIFQQPVWGKYWWTALTKKQMFQEDEWATTRVTNNNIGGRVPLRSRARSNPRELPLPVHLSTPTSLKATVFLEYSKWLTKCLPLARIVGVGGGHLKPRTGELQRVCVQPFRSRQMITRNSVELLSSRFQKPSFDKTWLIPPACFLSPFNHGTKTRGFGLQIHFRFDAVQCSFHRGVAYCFYVYMDEHCWYP